GKQCGSNHKLCQFCHGETLPKVSKDWIKIQKYCRDRGGAEKSAKAIGERTGSLFASVNLKPPPKTLPRHTA
ncbi:hypothetical protein, partial [Mesorhizobium sp. M8A.F.Ca.ET.021.01.1.1]|uniref:hypothetical protein n=1 Tax=Mesorhizobium sp. M8A.F.Ca.ET.021.01.1.1 TaxID=2496757 RepID=UPI001AEC73E6